MSETENSANTNSGLAVDDDDWLTATSAEPLTTGADRPPASSRRTLAVRVGLVAVGAVVGGIVVTSISHGGSTTTANGIPTAAIGQLPGNGQFPGSGQFPGNGGQLPTGPGGLSGEEHVTGTLVSVGSSSVTVKTSAGAATYTITSSSQIVRDGQLAALSALQPGDAVLVHVYPAGSGSQLTVERLFATSSTSSGTKT